MVCFVLFVETNGLDNDIKMGDPILIIGLGGTGQKTVRYLKSIIEPERQIYADNNILGKYPVVRYFAIDFDEEDPDKSYIEEELLPLTEHELFHKNPAAILSFIENLGKFETVNGNKGKATPLWEHILEWYPDRERKCINYSYAEDRGAGQWRALGRVGFSIYYEKILPAIHYQYMDLLGDKYARMKKQSVTGIPVFLISSLCGGTGSGIMFDIAYMLRTHHFFNRDIRLRGYFLLPEIFTEKDRGKRLFQNTYAALKEIAAFKNQHHEFSIRYNSRGDEYVRVLPGGRNPFSRIYLFDNHLGEKGRDKDIDSCCARIARIIKTCIKPVVLGNVCKISANINSDANVSALDPASRHVFSTISTLEIDLPILDTEQFKYVLGNKNIFNVILEQSILLSLDNDNITNKKSDSKKKIDDLISSFIGIIKIYINDSIDICKPIITKYVNIRHDNRDKLSLEEICSLVFVENNLYIKLKDDLINMFCSFDIINKGLSIGLIRKNISYFENSIFTFLNKFMHYESESEKNFYFYLERLKIGDLINKKGVLYRIYNKLLNKLGFKNILKSCLDMTNNITDVFNILNDPFNSDVIGTNILLYSFIQTVKHLVAEQFEINKSAIKVYDSNISHLMRYCENNIQAVGNYNEKSKGEYPNWINWTLAVADEEKLINLFKIPKNNKYNKTIKTISDGLYNALKCFYSKVGKELTSLYPNVKRINVNKGEENIDDFHPNEFYNSILNILNATTIDTINIMNKQMNYKGKLLYIDPFLLFNPAELKYQLHQKSSFSFNPGTYPTTINANKAMLLCPYGTDHPSYGYIKGEKLTEIISSALKEHNCDIVHHNERFMILYMEDLSHPAQQIPNISAYYRKYISAVEHPSMFHIHKEYYKLPEIASDQANLTEWCGNDRCNYNVALLDRNELFCPGCGLPIWTHCGNEGCNFYIEDFIRLRKTGILFCPDCNEIMKTHWWFCSTHGKIPMSKSTCPHCLEKQVADPSHRPDGELTGVCPNCIRIGIEKPFRLDKKLMHYYKYGVNGIDEAAYWEIKHLLKDHGLCPKCNAQLIPVHLKPGSSGSDSIQAFIYRKSGHYYSQKDYRAIFYTCHKCGFPLEKGEQWKSCPRCGSSLYHCSYCSDRYALYISEDNNRQGICSNCALPLPTVSMIDHKGYICKNIYGCEAGGNLMNARWGKKPKKCLICRNEDFGISNHKELGFFLGNCPVCSETFNENITTTDFKALDDNYESCPLCGISRTKLKVLDGFIKELVPIAGEFIGNKDPEIIAQNLYENHIEKSVENENGNGSKTFVDHFHPKHSEAFFKTWLGLIDLQNPVRGILQFKMNEVTKALRKKNYK